MRPVIGLAVREENRAVLEDPAINGLEITFESADDPLRVERYVEKLNPDYVSVHALKMSPASADPPSRTYLDAIAALAAENGADAISDHLGFTRDASDGVELGHFAPPPFTPAALDTVIHNIDFIQRHLRSFHFYIENIAYLFRFDGALSEEVFLCQVLERTGCGWLLDVTNVYANGLNFGYDAAAFIRAVVPAATRIQMHLAGGYRDEKTGMYIDSHSRPIPDPVWDLYRIALESARGKVDAVFIERDQDFPDESGWRQEVRHARWLAEAAT